jgi:hypothetical protein
LGEGDLSSFPESVLSLSLLYIVAVIANLWHSVILSPLSHVILRERSARRISWLRTGLSPSLSVILSSAKNLVFVFRINSAKQFEEINVVVNMK